MTEALCRCNRPIHDVAYVCTRCAAELRAALARTTKLAGEHEITIARLDCLNSTGGTYRDDLGWWKEADALEPMPLPFNPDAAIGYRAVMAELGTWARHIASERGTTWTPEDAPQMLPGRLRPSPDGLWWETWRRPMHPLATMAGYLSENLDWLRYRQEAPEAFRHIEDACKQAERIVDRRADRWYAGPCTTDGCGVDLYPLSQAATVECDGCGATYSTPERKTWLLREAEDVWGNAAWIAATLTTLGVRCTDAMVRGYAHRGRLAPHPDPDGRGHPRYRLGSVMEIVTGEMHDRARRQNRERQPA